MKAFRFLLSALFVVVFLPGIASQGQDRNAEFSLDANLDKAASVTTLVYKLGPGMGVESALHLENQDQILRIPYLRIRGWDAELFMGRGNPKQGRALRINPALLGIQGQDSPWKESVGSVTVPLVAGIKMGGLIFQSLWNKESVFNLIEIEKGLPLPGLTFKAGSMEASGSVLGIGWAGGVGVAESEEREVMDGWKAGSASEPEIDLLSLGGCAEYNAGPISSSFWLAASAGSLVSPGVAGAVDVGLSFTSTQIRAKNKHLKKKFTTSFKFRAYGCSSTYTTYLAEAPELDCSIKAEASIGFEIFRIWAGFSALSPFESQSAYGLRKIQDKGLESLLWRWRTERIQGLLGLGIGSMSLSARGRAGSHGLNYLNVVLGYTKKESSLNNLKFRTALNALFSPTPDTQGLDSDEESIVTELGETLSEQYTDEENGEFLGSLWLSRLRLELSLAWDNEGKPTARAKNAATAKGSATAALNLAFDSEGLEFKIHTEFAQLIPLGLRSSLELRLSTPSAGYSLDEVPAEWPELGLSARIF